MVRGDLTPVPVLLSAFADECAESLDGQIMGLHTLGIDRLEIRGVNGKNISALTPAEVRDTAARLADAGITVSAVGSPLGKFPADGDIDAHMETARRVLETARTLGTDTVRVFSFYPGALSGPAFEDAALGALDRMLTLAASFGVTLCHENEAGILGESPEACRRLLDAFAGRLRCVFDMGNFVLGGYDPWMGYELLRPYISYFHIKDATSARAIVPPGKGDAQIARILADFAARTGVPVPATLEPHLHAFVGLSGLTGRRLDMPYAYPDAAAAFADAARSFRAATGICG